MVEISQKKHESLINRNAFFDNSPDLFYAVDLDGKIQDVNERVLRVLGYTRKEMIGKSVVSTIYAEESQEKAKKILSEWKKNGKIRGKELKIKTKKGKKIDIELDVDAVRDKNGKIVRSTSIQRIITDRKRLEEQLVSTIDRLEFLSRASPVLIYMCEPRGDFAPTFVSENVSLILGYSVSEFLSEPTFWADRIHPEDKDRVFKNLKKLFKRASHTHEYRFLCKDGQYRWMRDELVLIRDKDGKPKELIGYIIDIDDTKKAGERLERFAFYLDTIPDVLSVTTLDTKIIKINKAFEKLWGYSAKEVIGKSILDLFPKEEIPKHKQEIEEASKTGRISEFETEIETKKGKRIPVALRGRTLKDDEGKTVALIAVMHDISERREVENGLKQRTEDLEIINTLNAMADKSASIHEICRCLSDETKKMFKGYGVSVYLLDKKEEYLDIQWLTIPPKLRRTIEKTIGAKLPLKSMRVRTEGIYGRIIKAKNPKITNDSKDIEKMISEFTENKAIRRLVPKVRRILNIESVISVPLISENKIIGLLDISRNEPFTKADAIRLKPIAEQATTIIKQRQLEEELRLKAQMIDGATDHIFLHDLDGNFIYINEAAYKARGYTKQELMDMKVAELDTPEMAKLIRPRVKNLLADGEAVFKSEHVCKDGSLIPIEVHARAIDLRDETFILSVCHDITERQKAEQELEMKARVLDAAVDSIFVHEIDGNIIYVNKMACQSRGYTRDEMKRMKIWDFVSPEQKKLVKPKMKKLLDTGESRFESTNICKDGTVMPVEVHANIINIDDKKLILSAVRDITERKRAEATLQESEFRYRKLFEDSPIPLWEEDFSEVRRFLDELKTSGVKDLRAHFNKHPDDVVECVRQIRVLDANKATLEFFDVENIKEFISNMEKFFAKDTYNVFIEQLVSLDEGSSIFEDEIEAITMKGERKVVDICVSITPSYKQSWERVLISFNDITLLKETEGMYEQNYAMQAAINSLIQICQKDISLDEIIEQSLDLILSIPWLVLESKGSIFLIEDDPNVLVMKAQRRLPKTLLTECSKLPIGKCLCGRAAESQEMIFADAIDERHETMYKGISSHGHYCVPIVYSGKTVGVINTYLKEGHCRSTRDEEFLTAVAHTLAGVIRRKKEEEKSAWLASFPDLDTNPIVEVTLDGELTYANPAARQLFPDLEKESVNHPFLAGLPKVITKIKNTKKGQSLKREVRVNSSIYEEQAYFVPDKQVFRIYSIDITDRKKDEEALRKGEARYHGLFDDSPVPIWEEDFSSVKGEIDKLKKSGVKDIRKYLKSHPEVVRQLIKLIRVIDVNNATLKLHKARSKKKFFEGIGKDFLRESTDEFIEELSAFSGGKTTYQAETGMRTLAGDMRLVDLQVSIQPGHEETWARVLVSFSDITERKKAEEALQQNYDIQAVIRSLLQLSQQDIPLEIVLENALDHIFSVSWLVTEQKGCIFLTREDSDILEMKVQKGFKRDVRSACAEVPFGECLCGQAAESREVVFSSQSKGQRHKEHKKVDDHREYSIPIVYAKRTLGVINLHVREGEARDRRSEGFFVAMADALAGVIERKLVEEKIKQLAYHDALTGLPNRIVFDDRIRISIAQAQRKSAKLAVMMLDLDRFKNVNDTLGHLAGDRLLKIAGSRLVEILRESDTVARMGGDEFLILLPEVSGIKSATTIAKKILDEFRRPFSLGEHKLHSTTSIGIAMFPDDGRDAGTLLANVDKALYRAKDLGRDRYQLYNA